MMYVYRGLLFCIMKEGRNVDVVIYRLNTGRRTEEYVLYEFYWIIFRYG